MHITNNIDHALIISIQSTIRITITYCKLHVIIH